MKKRRVVVTGIGMVTPLGNSVLETWKNLIEGKSGISFLTRFNPDDYKAGPDFPRIAGEVKDFDSTKWGIDKKVMRRTDRFVQLVLAAGIEAFQDSKVNFEKEDSFRIGVQIGAGLGGATTLEEQYRILLNEGAERISAFFIPKLIVNMGAGNISMYLGAMGPNISTTTACAASAHAIGEAFDKIRFGRADLMICGGTEAGLTALAFAGFNSMRALSRRNEPEKASRPFDKGRDGFVMSEGAGVIVLEELHHAQIRGAKIYGELVGFGMTGDAYHITEPSIKGPSECMRLALKDAKINPAEINYINAHATSTPVGDINEAKAIAATFGKETKNLFVGSTKSMTGHLLGAAGAVESIFSILALKEGKIPPTTNLEESDCDFLNIPTKSVECDIEYVLSNSFGFGGTNACLIFKKFKGG